MRYQCTDQLLVRRVDRLDGVSMRPVGREFGVNGRPGRADGEFVTEVDSVRLLASEYNLEFVDLDRFPIDTSAASVLPAPDRQAAPVVPVARKFGAPVIAISDPGDIVAIDTLRTSIGREFISVVASAGADRGHASTASTAMAHSQPRSPRTERPPPRCPALEGFDSLERPRRHSRARPRLDARGAGARPRTTPIRLRSRSATRSPIRTPVPAIPGPARAGRRRTPDSRTTRPPTSSATGRTSEDEVALTADLVEEAVAEFEHSGGDAGREAADSELASFPPLGSALIEGGRVSLADMESVLREHNTTGQTIARILTARGLVTEADLMWGMANEMGLEFVDLDQPDRSTTASLTCCPRRRHATTTSQSSTCRTAFRSSRPRTRQTSSRWTTCARSSVGTS